MNEHDMNPAQPSGLGSLAQSARSKKLNSARSILLFIGILTVVANGIFMSLARSQVQQEIEKEINKLGPEMIVDRVKVKEIEETAVRFAHLVGFGAVVLGVVFVVCGLTVKTYPVPITVLSLVLYLGATAVFGLLDPKTLAAGLIIKIIIVVALVKAVQTAIAFQREETAARAVEMGL